MNLDIAKDTFLTAFALGSAALTVLLIPSKLRRVLARIMLANALLIPFVWMFIPPDAESLALVGGLWAFAIVFTLVFFGQWLLLVIIHGRRRKKEELRAARQKYYSLGRPIKEMHSEKLKMTAQEILLDTSKTGDWIGGVSGIEMLMEIDNESRPSVKKNVSTEPPKDLLARRAAALIRLCHILILRKARSLYDTDNFI